MRFKDELGKRLIFCDGGLGTMLQSLGLPVGKRADHWSVEEPEKVKSVHLQYIEAGCEIITADTFAAAMGGEYSPQTIARAGVRIAKEAIAQSGRQAFCALDVSSLGELLEPLGNVSFDEAYDRFAAAIRAGADEGADLVIIETMTDTYEIKAALLAAKENCSLPVGVTFTIDESGRLMNGADVITAAALIESLGADFVGLNCGFGPDKMLEFAPQLLSFTSLPVLINPNAGMPTVINGRAAYTLTPEEFAISLEKLVRLGCAAVGGCCGTTPAHLKSAVERCRGLEITKPAVSRQSYISSGSQTVFFGDKTVLIGERINPTGKPKLKAALREGDYAYLCNEAVAQAQAGADVLDVNVGISEIDEPAVLESAVKAVQAVSPLPLQLDTSDAEALERALRIYNGRPLINSVNGSEKSLNAVLPLAKKYGAMVVGLTLDESGIPDSAEKRIEIAERIIDRAAQYGIGKDSLIIDPLTLTISTGDSGALPTLAALKYIRETLGVHTVLGVSNISFGLPCREKINAAFFTLAMQNGLSAGIINPLNAQLMDSYYAFNALTARDASCLEYIANYSGMQEEQQLSVKKAAADVSADSLNSAVVKGLCEQASQLTEQLIKTVPAMEIINSHLIPALDEVGSLFESKKLFLPQLLLSAKAAAGAFDIIKTQISAKGESKQSKGKIILATVKGDVHDIGKNIVKVLLENYGYEVIDLGRDVAPQTVADCAKQNGVKLVGLSALMTTTLPAMKETIALLRGCCECKIMVGGAVLTEEYSKQIGADFYGRDAMCSVRYAESLSDGGEI